MTAFRQLTAAASSEHPDAATAVGEVVGEIQDRLDGSPEFSLVLVSDNHRARLPLIANAVQSLLGPDIMVASSGALLGCGGMVLEHSAVVVWALSGVDGIDGIDVMLEPLVQSTAARLQFVSGGDHDRTRMVLSAGSTTATAAREPMVAMADERPRSGSVVIVELPASRARVTRSFGPVEVGLPMPVSEIDDRNLLDLDGRSARLVLIDLLQTEDSQVNGPAVDVPPLKLLPWPRHPDNDNLDGAVDVLAVDDESGAIELGAPVGRGDIVQIVRHDPARAVADVVNRLRVETRQGSTAVLLSSDLAPGDLYRLLAEAQSSLSPTAVSGLFQPQDRSGRHTATGPGRWPSVEALVVRVDAD